ncbi:hypothetical protein NOS26_11055 [Megasphaera sp. SC8-1]|nr:hypothetical protein [Megasphaera sp. SC8-1]MCQ4113750.1 hypothetical protein [Megasphaera sp. SC8-1]
MNSFTLLRYPGLLLGRGINFLYVRGLFGDDFHGFRVAQDADRLIKDQVFYFFAADVPGFALDMLFLSTGVIVVLCAAPVIAVHAAVLGPAALPGHRVAAFTAVDEARQGIIGAAALRPRV